MSTIFISHSSGDNHAAAEVKICLEKHGHRSIFLDFDPEVGIPAGRNWERELYRQLRACRAVIVLCSERSMASRWVFAEITHARALGKQIFAIRIEPCEVHSLLTDRQIIDWTKDPQEAFQRLARGLDLAGIDAADPLDWDSTRSPYPGLLAFQEEDAAVFFGRDREIGAGLDVLNQVARYEGRGLAMVLGASGSGKSSLVRAGITPRLRRDPERWLPLDAFRPGDDPMRALAGALAGTFRRAGQALDYARIRETLQRGPGDDAGLQDLLLDLQHGSGHPEATPVLILDQFEELLGHLPDHPARPFLSMLRAALHRASGQFVVLATMRSDFMAAFQKSPTLGDLAFRSVPLGPMPVEALAEVIQKPAERAGVDVEQGLVQAMLDDARDQDALPLLAFALRRLYEEHAADGLLAVREYREQLGGLQGAVAKVANDLMAAQRLSSQEKEALRTAFLTMVRVNEQGGRYARRPVSWDQLPQEIHPLLERFVQARLLVSRGGGPQRTLEVAHEALFESWDALKGWLDSSREALLLRQELVRAARLWVAAGRSAEYLWRGNRLRRALKLRNDRRLLLTQDELSFLAAVEPRPGIRLDHLDLTTEPGKRTAERVHALREHLIQALPRRDTRKNVLIATWSFRLQRGRGLSRLAEAVAYIAEIISHFDLVALQEVGADLGPIREIQATLGEAWQLVHSGVSEGAAGNQERLAYLYDSRKVQHGGMAGQLVRPPSKDGEPAQQPARPPFLAGFQVDDVRFTLCNVHIRYGRPDRAARASREVPNDLVGQIDTNAASRIQVPMHTYIVGGDLIIQQPSGEEPLSRIRELEQIALLIARSANRVGAWSPSVLLLGDYNVESGTDPGLEAVAQAGFIVPEALRDQPTNMRLNRPYDQIALRLGPQSDRLAPGRSGVINYYEFVFRGEDQSLYVDTMGDRYRERPGGQPRPESQRQAYLRWRTTQMSDHLPKWLELRIRASDREP